MPFKKHITGFLFAALLSTQLFGQDCEAVLNKAVEEFNAGHFSGISALLNDCLKGGFTREQRERAYMLLTQTYLLLDDPFGAEQSYLSLLRANPEFLADENRDPIDVFYLSKKFTTTPIFSLYLKLGSNISTISVINNYSVWNDGSKKYKLKPGFQVGAGLDWNYSDNLIFSTEFNLAFTGYKQEESGFNLGRDSKDVTDRQGWFMIPVMAKYSYNKGKFRPFGYAGYSFNFLFRDVTNITLVNQEPTGGGDGDQLFSFKPESPDLNYKSRRNSTTGSFLLGGGLKYKKGLDFWFADIRYAFGLTNLVNPDRRYADYRNLPYAQGSFTDPLYTYAHVEDDFRLNNLFVSVGYIHPLYKPRKVKKAKTKSILRKIGKTSE